jgi:hypothetical protein
MMRQHATLAARIESIHARWRCGAATLETTSLSKRRRCRRAQQSPDDVFRVVDRAEHAVAVHVQRLPMMLHLLGRRRSSDLSAATSGAAWSIMRGDLKSLP